MAKVLTQREMEEFFQTIKFNTGTLQTVSEKNPLDAIIIGADTLHAGISIIKAGFGVNLFGSLVGSADLINTISNWENRQNHNPYQCS